jgi:Domain of unknown function (DUF1992)
MPTGQPDSPRPGDPVEAYSDRLIREAMESGQFDDLPGAGKPIPGAGTRDDDGWWVRGWIERNTDPSSNQDSSNNS